MAEIKELNRETILEAISVIKTKPEIRNGRESTTYDLVYEGDEYPPILVLSEANKIVGGDELKLSDFNNSTNKPFSILSELGFKVKPKTNENSAQEQLIEDYKNLLRKDRNKPELYKWQLIKEFQDKWDLDANDFSSMVQRINFGNLLDYRSKTFVKFSHEYSKEARSLFKMLYDEEIPLENRIKNFGNRAEKIVKKHHPDIGAFQDERSIATYLTFRYPNKYTFYKYSIYSDYTDLLNLKREKAGKRYIHYLELIDEFVNNYISQDKELLELSRDTLKDDCFTDDNYNILAQDILYRTTQRSTENLSESKLFDPKTNKAWIEKTLVSGRSDREDGDYSLGKRLWSPRKDARGADIYSNMREVESGDLILHLTDNEGFTGVSLASGSFIEGQGVEESNWEGEAYIIDLEDYREIKKIDRDRILNDKYRKSLDQIRDKNDVFYNRNLNLRQGAYLTECPIELLEIINSEYKSMSQSNLPFLDSSEINVTNSESFEIDEFIDLCKRSGLIYNENINYRFVSALATKPFLILTGLSGSGKTKLAQSFVEWMAKDKHQINLIPVGADWTNREPLLGYPNALKEKDYVLPDSGLLQLILRADKDEEHPYFLILDEMNLSHVERYFADFLSAIESKEEIKLHSGEEGELWNDVPPTIKIPENLFIIGTVNIDETTYMFSPKVLDRANVLEFRVSQAELAQFLENPADVDLDILRGEGSPMAEDFVEIAKSNGNTYSEKEKLSEELLKFFSELNTVGAEFGYRSAYEIQRFAALSEQLAKDWEFDDIMDAAVAQKLLPKLHGSRRKLEKVLFKLGDLCYTETAGESENLFKRPETIEVEKARYPISFEKIVRMHKGLVENGFTSFAEA